MTRNLSQRLRNVVLVRGDDAASDAELLSQYLAARDEDAFQAIVLRHGPMVLGVCRRVLGNRHDAEDAFQATFLVLALKGATIVPRERLSDWLHGVAMRTAMKARTTRARWHARARQTMNRNAKTEAPNCDGSDLSPILDQELAALAERYRLGIVLCDLEGKSRKEAARQLGWKEGTLSGRLARGRHILATRLRRRGVARTATGIGAAAAPQALAEPIPAALLSRTLEAVALAASGNLAAISTPVAALTTKVMKSMFVQKLKKMSLVIAVALFGVGVPLGLSQAPPERPQTRAGDAEIPAEDKKPQPASVDLAHLGGRLIVHRGFDLAFFDPRKQKFDDQNRLPPTPDAFRGRMPQYDAQNRTYSLDFDGTIYQTLSARLSPDMHTLAFWADKGKIRIRDTRTADQSKVVVDMPGRELSRWSWSPDGKKLSFLVWNEGDEHYHPYIVDIESGKIEKAVLPELEGDGPEGWGAAIEAWSPDGLWLVHAEGHFFLVNPETKQARRLTSKLTGYLADTCRFSPDGKRLLFIGAPRQDSWNLSVIDLLLGKMKVIAVLDRRRDFAACWGPDSRHIALTSVDADENQKTTGPSRLEIYDATSKEKPVVVLKGTAAASLTVIDWR